MMKTGLSRFIFFQILPPEASRTFRLFDSADQFAFQYTQNRFQIMSTL